MDVSKLRDASPERIQDSKVRDSGSAAKTGRVKATDAGATSSTKDAAPTNDTDKVRLSHDSVALKEGIEAAKAAPSSRADKVAALKTAIQNGTYKMDNKAIAEKMIQHSLEDDLLTRME